MGGTTGVSGQDCDRREFSVLRSFVSDKEDFVSPGGGVFCVFLVGFVFFLLIPVTADMFDLIFLHLVFAFRLGRPFERFSSSSHASSSSMWMNKNMLF